MNPCPTCGHNPAADCYEPTPVLWLREWAAQPEDRIVADLRARGGSKLRRVLVEAADSLGSAQAEIAALRTMLTEARKDNAA